MTPLSDFPSAILVVDDDASIRDAIADFLGMHGYAVRAAENAVACDRALTAAPADLIVLDVMMPGEDGLSLCRRLGAGGTPILMLSALDAVTDRIVGLEVGAWDYMTKPFEPRELLARVRALLRRPAADRGELRDASGEALMFAGWWFDVEQRRLRAPSGIPMMLTEGEHALLAAFVRRPGRILSRDVLLDLARGVDAAPYDRAIDIAVSRLRRKLAEADPAPLIETVRGAGYRFLPAVQRA
ncbi:MULTISPECIES: response regulator [unclassified Sphingomonas]|jgi:two-component system OmpR family response regulator|uniref:response regulator n=1 Tax=unclassified Sphingomonas TaxID=196159 RepID=UPI000836ACE4|nr:MULTISPECIES: response regulator [unclassified Sphingomonas]MCH4891513.1 response regulator [Sphingomonas sp. SFZ2018-12]